MRQVCTQCGHIELAGQARSCPRCGQLFSTSKGAKAPGPVPGAVPAPVFGVPLTPSRAPPASPAAADLPPPIVGTPLGGLPLPPPTPRPMDHAALSVAPPSTWDMNPEGPSFTRVSGLGALRNHGVPERVVGADASRFKLTPMEGFLLGLSDGATNADDIVAASSLKALDAAWAFFRLKELGLIRFREEEDRNAALKDALGNVRAAEAPNQIPGGGNKLGAISLQRIMMGTASAPAPSEQNPATLLAAAQDCVRKGDMAGARDKVRMAWALAPDNAEVMQARQVLESPQGASMRAQMLHEAALLQLASQPFQALRLWELALAEHEASPVIHHHLAIVLHSQKQSPQRVMFHLARTLQLQPTNMEAQQLMVSLASAGGGR